MATGKELLVNLDTVFNKVVFEGDGYAIFGTSDGLSACGNILDGAESLLDTPLLLLGHWDTYKGKGQFRFNSYQIQENQLFFFLTKMVRGIPATAAREISQTYSDDEIDAIMENNPEALRAIKGIGPVKLAKIQTKWAEFAPVRKLGRILLPYGITNNLILRINDHFGPAAVDIATGDTYRLTEVRGIGFKIADSVAMRLGVDPKDPRRLAACAIYCLREKMANNGDTAITLADLCDSVAEEIKVDEIQDLAMDAGEIIRVIGDLLGRSGPHGVSLVTGAYPDPGCFLTLPYLLKYETKILEIIEDRTTAKPIIRDIDAWIAQYEKKVKRTLGDQQRVAVRMANTPPRVFAITGYAGTGKSTSAGAVLELMTLRYNRSDIVCCALSGIAAARVRTTSGFPGSTIHTLLGYRGSEWTYNATNRLPYKVVLLDEGSMVDSEMMYRLMSAIDFEAGAVLIILGDPAQLQSVGAGAPFADMLDMKLIANVTLDKIYRQSEDKVITLFAASVRQGLVPNGFAAKDYGDFRFVERTIGDGSGQDYFRIRKSVSDTEMADLREQCNLSIQTAILDEAGRLRGAMHQRYVTRDIWGYLTHFQVLTPMKKGSVGTADLNRVLQGVLNPDATHNDLRIGTRVFRERDKVVHLRNKDMDIVPMGKYRDHLDGKPDTTEKRRVFNGQLGAIVRIDKGEDEIHIVYPNEGYVAIYSKIDLTNYVVDHAYALSVHKSQGSEFANVCLPMTMSHYTMLDPKLIYTGMTRAKDNLVMIGQKFAFEAGCRKIVETVRKTCIQLLAPERIIPSEVSVAQASTLLGW